MSFTLCLNGHVGVARAGVVPALSHAEVPVFWDQILRVEDGEGLCVSCQDGRVWLTQANDPRDHVLERGGDVLLKGRGHVLIVGLPEGRVRVSG